MADFTLTIPDAVMGIPPQDPEKPKGDLLSASDDDFVEIDFHGMTVEVPKRASKDQVKAMLKKAMLTPEFDSMVDKQTGASYKAAFATGSRSDAASRLATLRMHYPDATPYGDDNFVFTHPQTGRPTLYNPTGFEGRDVASLGADIMVGIGSGIGATMGTIFGVGAGAPSGPGAVATGISGGVLGAGWGSAFTRGAFDALAEMHGIVVDKRTVTEELTGLGLEFAGGAIGQKVGMAIGEAAAGAKKAIFGGGTTLSQRLLQSFKEFGIDPTAGMVTGGKGTVAKVEALSDQAPAGATIFVQNAEKVMAQTVEAVDGMAAKYGDNIFSTKEGIGGGIIRPASEAAKRDILGSTDPENMVKGYFPQLYDNVFERIGLDNPVSALKNTESLLMEMSRDVSTTPNLAARSVYKNAITMMEDIIDDVAEGGMNFQGLRTWRTQIGQMLDNASAIGSDTSEANLKRIYGALSRDMTAAAESISPEGAAALKQADAEYGKWMGTSGKLLNKIIQTNADEEIYKSVFSSVSDGGTRLRALKNNFTEDEWGSLAGSYLKRMGLANPGGQNAAGDAFSPSTFMTVWGKTSKEAKYELFGGSHNELRQELDRLVGVVESMKNLRGQANTSNSAGAIMMVNAFNALGTIGTLVATGHVLPAITTGAALVGGTVAAPIGAAKLMTNPGFVKWLAKPMDDEAKGVAVDVGAHIGRLYILGEKNPQLKEAINHYLIAIKGVSSYNPSNNGDKK
jgi:hypothetical protein